MAGTAPTLTPAKCQELAETAAKWQRDREEITGWEPLTPVFLTFHSFDTCFEFLLEQGVMEEEQRQNCRSAFFRYRSKAKKEVA